MGAIGVEHEARRRSRPWNHTSHDGFDQLRNVGHERFEVEGHVGVHAFQVHDEVFHEEKDLRHVRRNDEVDVALRLVQGQVYSARPYWDLYVEGLGQKLEAFSF